jgi:hypothetical protein
MATDQQWLFPRPIAGGSDVRYGSVAVTHLEERGGEISHNLMVLLSRYW